MPAFAPVEIPLLPAVEVAALGLDEAELEPVSMLVDGPPDEEEKRGEEEAEEVATVEVAVFPNVEGFARASLEYSQTTVLPNKLGSK
jgi:hypothetical protein